MLKSKYSIRLGTTQDTPWIMEAIELCRPILAAHQSGQWQGTEPSQKTIENDILHRQFYLLTFNDRLIGGAALLPRDNAYDHLLSGAWLNQDPYIVIHRFFIHPTFHGQKLSKVFLTLIEEWVWRKGINNIRLDTHERNIPMKGLLRSMSYLQVGRVNLPQAGERMVYHKERGFKHEFKR
jgi:GNAT superfamily N-acetyltransferase